MQHITVISRNQMTLAGVEDTTSTEAPIRFIDAFVNHIDLTIIDCTIQTLKTER